MQGGFTLLEMIVVVSMFSLLIGVALPISELFIRSKMVEATRSEMLLLSDAITNYYEDTESFPSGLDQLVENTDDVDNWMGPYVPLDFVDADENSDDYAFDEWRTAYAYTATGAFSRSLESYGQNRVNEGEDGDDIALDIDVGVVLRDITRDELKALNAAIATYNLDFLFSPQLSTDYLILLGQLQDEGYLPDDADTTEKLSKDGWGQNYTTGGVTPVVEVFSLGAP